MSESKVIDLPSGAKLEITVAPFSEAKALWAAVASELKGLKLDPEADVDVNFWKDLFCTAIESKKLEDALRACLKRCTYNGKRIIDDSIFEPVEARDDYLAVCYEVTKENVSPFMKSLSARYAALIEQIKALASA